MCRDELQDKSEQGKGVRKKMGNEGKKKVRRDDRKVIQEHRM